MIQKPYFAGLDILRLLASLAVFVWHLQESYWGGLPAKFTLHGHMGNPAVSFFFALSGFLLSYLLFTERAKTNTIAIRSFFMRRILRIWPLYFAVIIIAFFLYPVFIKAVTGHEIVERASLWRYCLFIPNYDVAYYAMPVNNALGVMWSLGVEEQFYVFLPFFVLAFIRWRPLMAIVLLAMIGFSFWYGANLMAYYDTLSVMYSMLFGMLISMLSFFRPDLLSRVVNKTLLLTALIAFFAYCCWLQFGSRSPAFTVPAKCFELLCFGAFILNFSFYGPLREKILQNRFSLLLVGLGKKYTYSLYLLHELALVFTTLLLRYVLHVDSFIVYTGVSVIALSLIVWLAYRFVEEPILKLKDRFSVLT